MFPLWFLALAQLIELLVMIENSLHACGSEHAHRQRLNLIVHGVPESQADTGTSRRDDDINFVTSCLKDHLDMSVTIEKAFRLGKRSDTQSDRPRFLKITLNSERQKYDPQKMCKTTQ